VISRYRWSAMSETEAVEDPLTGWGSRRRAALRRMWERFEAAGGNQVSLSDELVAERRREAAAEDSEPAGE
jgi:hypothetical protein